MLSRLPEDKEIIINQKLVEMEKRFLDLFLKNLMNKSFINNSIQARESACIIPCHIFITDHETLSEHSDQVSDGYYFIEDENFPILMHVKNGISKILNLTERDKVNEVIHSILSKKPHHVKNRPLTTYGIDIELGKLTDIIHAIPGHEETTFTTKYLTIQDCEKKHIFTTEGAIDRQACSNHSVKIDEKRINIVALHQLDDSIQLSHRENLIIEAVISYTMDQLLNSITLQDCYKLFPQLNQAERGLIDSMYVTHTKNLAHTALNQCKNMKLKGAPFYEPTEAFIIDIYMSMLEIGATDALAEKIKQDADKIILSIKNMKEYADISATKLNELTKAALFKKYSYYLTKFDSEFDIVSYDALQNLIVESVGNSRNNTKTYNSPKPEALRLIMHRGEGLVKMLNPIFIEFSEILQHNDMQKWKSDVATVDQKWEFTFEQLLNPRTHRPKRQVLPDPLNGFCFSPLLQAQVDPSLLEVQSLDHTVMTSTTLLPKDGKMRLFGASHHHAIGLLFDIRLCDLVGEHFVFDTDTYTINDWWHNPNATRYHNEFKGRTVNQLIKDQSLHQKVDYIRDYNEILSGVNAAGVTAILFQPAVDVYHSDKKDMNYYDERLNLIYRKLYVASIIGRHLPIIIFDAHKGTYQYTLEEQLIDLQTINKLYPNNSILEALLNQFENLCKVIPEESEIKKKPIINTDDISKLEKKKNIRIEIFKLQNEINHLNQKLFILSNKQTLSAVHEQLHSFFNEINDSYKINKSLMFDLISERTKQLQSLLIEFQNNASPEEYNDLSALIEKQKTEIYIQWKNNSIIIQNMILSICSKRFDDENIYKNTLLFLIHLAKNPEYTNQKCEIQSLIEKQKENIKNNIIAEIKRDYPKKEIAEENSNILSFSSFFSSISFSKIDDDCMQNKLISKALNKFEKNIKFNPGIYNLEQLIIAHVKRKAITVLMDKISELCTPQICVNQFGAHVVKNRQAGFEARKYQLLVDQLKTLDLDLPLHTFFNKNHKTLRIDYDDKVISQLITMATRSVFIPKVEDRHHLSGKKEFNLKK